MEEPRAPALVAALATCRRRRRWVSSVCGSAAAVVTLGLAGPLLIGLDAWARASDGWRWMAWSLVMMLAAGVFWRHVRGALRLGNEVAVAQDLERRAGVPGALLSSGISLLRAPPRAASDWMTGRTIALANQAAAGVHHWSKLVPLPRTWPIAGLGVLVLMTVASVVPLTRPWLQRASWPGSMIGRPGSLQLEALPGSGTLPTGDDLTLTAVLRDVHGALSSARTVAAFISWQDGREEQRQLAPSADNSSVWQVMLPPVTCALSWRIRADRDGDGQWDGESDRRALTLIEGFSPSEVIVRLTPPTYSRWPTQTLRGGDATCLAGTTITAEVAILSGGPRLVAATIMLEAEDGSAQRELPAIVQEHIVSATWTARSTQRWGLRLIAAGGHEELPDRRWRIAVTTDQPPAVHLDNVPKTLAADAREVLVVLAEDDVGIRDTTVEIRRTHRTGELLTQIRCAPPPTIAGPEMGSRQQRADIFLDAAALGLHLGESLAVVPVTTDHAGQTTRGEAAVVVITSDGSAGWAQVATNLRRVLTAIDQAAATLPSVMDGAERAGVDAVALRVAAARRSAWCSAVSLAATPWPPLAELTAAGAQTDRASRAAVAEIEWWAQQMVPQLPDEQPSDAESSRTVIPLNGAPAELQHLRHDLALREQYATAQAQAAQATAAAVAVSRQARAVRADVLWQTRPAPGLQALFSADADGAVLSQPRVEVPDFRDRDVPGHGPHAFRIHYSGLLRVPDSGAELAVTADDGVRLAIAGIARLPGEAWGDHAATTWRTARIPGGWHAIELTYRQGAGRSELHLTWGDGTALTGDELRATRASGELAVSDSLHLTARTSALTGALERLGLTPPPAPWTVASITHCVEQAQAAASAATEKATLPMPPPPRGTVALAVTMAEVALRRQDVTTALAWLARASELTETKDSPDTKRLKQDLARLAKLGAKADTHVALKQLNQELVRLRGRVPQPSNPVEENRHGGGSHLVNPRHARDTARGNVALAAAALALELREVAPVAVAVAEQAEALDRTARALPPVNDETVLAEAAELLAQVTTASAGASSLATMVADGGIADPARENGARRVAAAIERLTGTAERLTQITQRPQAPLASDQSAPVAPLPLTHAGRQRSRLTLPTIDESGIDGFRPDQQQAIRAYLDRLRRQAREAQ